MKKIIYSCLFLGILIALNSCKEDSFEDLIPQKYEKILYLKANGQQNLTLFNDGSKVDYTVTVGKTGSNPAATAQAQLKVMSQTEIDNDEHYTGNNYSVFSNECYIYKDQSLDFTSSETYKSVIVQLIPEKMLEEIRASENPNAVFILPIRLSSQTDSVNTDKCDLIIKPKITELSIAFKKGNKIIDLNNDKENNIILEVEMAMAADVQNTWNFTAGMQLITDKEILDSYNEDNNTNLLMIPADAATEIEAAVFEAGNNESAGTITIQKDKLSKGQTYLVPLKLAPITEYENISTSNKLFYGILEYSLDMVNDKIQLTTDSFNDVYGGWCPANQFPYLLDKDLSTHFETAYWEVNGKPAGNSTYGVPLDIKIGKEVNSIMFEYITRTGGGTNPGDMTLYVSNDDEVLTNSESTSWRVLGVPANLIAAGKAGQTYTSKVFSSADKFKYLRIAVKRGNGPCDGTVKTNCWGMAEFSLWAY